MVLLKKGHWVLIADGKKAVFLRNNLNTAEYDLRVVWHQETENPPSREHGTDRPGRTHSIPGVRRAALNESDWHQLQHWSLRSQATSVPLVRLCILETYSIRRYHRHAVGCRVSLHCALPVSRGIHVREVRF